MKNILPKILNYKKRVTVPIQITIDISGECNAKCPFCPRQILDQKSCGFMSKDIFYAIVKQIEEIKTIKIVSLAALGEPLLHPDFDEFVDYLHFKKYRIMFPTNMSLAHLHYETLLKATKIIYSIEGHNQESYERLRKNLSFNSVLKNVRDFDEIVRSDRESKKHTPARLLNFIVTKNSSIKEHLSTWGDYIDAVRIAPVGIPNVWDEKQQIFIPPELKEMQDEIISLKHKTIKNKCSQPFELITIRPDGKIALCCSDTGCSLDFGDYKNIKKSFFENKNLKKIRKELENDNIKVCKHCCENYELTKDDLADILPELNDIDSSRIKVY